jgi:hypothetical protein
MKRPALTTALVAAGLAGAVLVPTVASSPAPAAPAQVAAETVDAPRPVDTRNYDVAGLTVGRQLVAQRQAAAARAAEQARAAQLARTARLAALRKARAERRASRSRRAAAAPVAYGSPRAIARAQLAARGWSSQYGCLDSLWQRESGWRVSASNASGAYGIPQALPGSKMASAGSDWRTNPATQIRWGLGYIGATYGGPCAAWSHSQSTGWY